MPLDPKRVKEIFLAVAEKNNPADRAAFLAEACGGDEELRRRVEGLLAAHDASGGWLGSPDPVPVDETPGSSPAPDPEATTDHPRPQLGTLVAGRYKLLEQIGEGGMGTVWVAEQMQPIRRKVALKLIKAGMDSKTVLSRFEAERQALALMDHPHIAKVLDGGSTEDGRPFFVMEYVKGVPFTQYCDDARLSIAERLALFVPVCQAVQHAHQKGIIHRDLKPSNVLVCLYDGKPVPKVIDFGLAKAMHQPLTEHTLYTAHGMMMGTPLYMSPEQAEFNNLDVDTRTDIYALGVILYELLTGTTPLEKQRFQKAAWHEMLRLIKEEEPPRPSARLSGSGSLPSLAAQRQLEPVKLTKLVRGELDWIVMKCLEKDRTRRYETANGLARDLERYLHDETVEACPPSASYRLRKFVRRNKGRVLSAGVFAAMLILIVGLVLFGAWWAERKSAERGHEKALTAARTNSAFKATLDRIEAALKSGRLAEAGTLAGQADQQIDEQTPADLRERYEQLKRDERTVRELDDIFEERWMVSPSDIRIDSERAKRRYPSLFRSYGLDVGMEPAAVMVEKIRQSIIAEALSSGMTEWFFVDPKYTGLLAVVDMLDPDPGRAALRLAIVRDKADRVAEISKTIDGSQLSPAHAIGLGTHPAVEHGLRILKAAWTAHPDSFPLALTISGYSCIEGSLNTETIGWSRTAIALRPNNPLAHYYLAVALSERSGVDVARVVDELRRTIRLAPRFARAHGRLAFVLRFREHRDTEALVAARQAIELDNENALGQFVIYVQLLTDKDYVGAARVYRRLSTLMGKVIRDKLPSEMPAEYWSQGFMDATSGRLWRGLIDASRAFEAYRLILDDIPDGHLQLGPELIPAEERDSSPSYLAVHAAALAGCGKGLDAPPPADRPAIRRHALEWLSAGFNVCKRDVEALPVFGANSVGLISSPLGHGPLLLAVSALSAGSPYAPENPAASLEIIHDWLKHWLSHPDLTGIRDDKLLDKLPVDEREQWRKFWSEVRALYDRTALPMSGRGGAKE